MSDLTELPINELDGTPSSIGAQADGKAALIVNVASKCGLTPQYEGLERLHESYAERGFTVLGVPCNQFLEQEPGSAEEIATFCSTTYGVTFPLFEKVEVNGDGRHPIYAALTQVADGATILVRPGWYEQQVVLTGSFTQGITIRSEVPYQAQLRYNREQVVTCFDAQGIALEGFDIAHLGPGAGIYVVQIQDELGA